MKILFDQQIFVSQKYGGISRYFYEIANRMAEMPGHKIQVFAPVYVNEYFDDTSKARPFGIKKPKAIRLTRIVNAINSRLPDLFLKRRKDIDIFHETYYSMIDNCPASAKRVITVYDMIHEKFPQYFAAGSAEKILQEKVCAIHRADHIICISENTKSDLMQILSVPEEKISVVHLGCSLKSASLAPDIESPLVSGPFLLYVGSRVGYKNFERLIRAYASSEYLKTNFKLVCFGGNEFTIDETSQMQSLNIPPDRVTQMNGNDDLLTRLYESAAVFVYPSLYEGFGIPLLEAMSLGCPVACANAGSIPEVAGDAAEFFSPNDSADICAAITRIAANPGHASELVKKGRARAELFSWAKCASETLNVYQKILGR